MTRTSNTVGALQKRAWRFYGWAGDGDNKAVGEVRYVVGWLADQMTRLDWDILIDDSDKWEVTLPAEGDKPAETIRTKDGDEEDLTGASRQLLDLIDWNDTNVRAVTTNLFVAGEGTYAKVTNKDDYAVISVVEKDAQKKVEKAVAATPFLWSHPADQTKPDAPLFSVLELLDELDWLNRQGRTQSRQRVLMNGVVLTADGFAGPNDTSFWDEWNQALSARMADPDDMSPVRLKGPLDLVKDGFQWVAPPFGYDDVLDRKVTACIHRLAYGLPIPPEILLGMQAQSRATAFQVEENAYRAHIEPPAMMVAQVAQDALNEVLDKTVTVVPNPARLLARKNSVQDVKDAYDRDEVSGDYLREVLGIPEDEAPVAEEDVDPAVKTALDMAVAAPSLAQTPGLPDLVAQIRSILDGTPYVPVNPQPAPAPIEPDPSNVAADEPVTAAARTPDLSDLLADVDASLSSELAGVTVMATDRARQRLGAAALSNETVRGVTGIKTLTKAQVAAKLGFDGLSAAGVDVADQITEPVDSAATWWDRRITEAWSQVAVLVPGWEGQDEWRQQSAKLLTDALVGHIVDTLSEPEPAPLDAGDLRRILDAAAGG